MFLHAGQSHWVVPELSLCRGGLLGWSNMGKSMAYRIHQFKKTWSAMLHNPETASFMGNDILVPWNNQIVVNIFNAYIISLSNLRWYIHGHQPCFANGFHGLNFPDQNASFRSTSQAWWVRFPSWTKSSPGEHDHPPIVFFCFFDDH